MTNSLHQCGHAEHRGVVLKPKNGSHLVIDVHCHLDSAPAQKHLLANVDAPPPPMPFTCEASLKVNKAMFESIAPKLFGVDERLKDMDALGIDIQAISPSPGQYFYFTPPELGRDLCHIINDEIAEAAATHPSRIVGMGTVPLQSTEFAITEMKRCVNDLGLRGIEISTNVNGTELSAPELRPFFAAAEELGVLIFIHPLGFTHGERLSNHYLNNIIGNPIESTIALSHLIFDGVLDSYPGLRICVAHGGGYLPMYPGRMDHAYHAREDCRQHINKPPSSYLKNVWFDTLVYDRQQLDNMINSYDIERLCMGTDYPFDMAEPDPVAFHEHLDQNTKVKILGANAARLLGLTT